MEGATSVCGPSRRIGIQDTCLGTSAGMGLVRDCSGG